MFIVVYVSVGTLNEPIKEASGDNIYEASTIKMENVEKSNNNTDEVSSPKRPQFGGRLLTDPNDVFKHNACFKGFYKKKKIIREEQKDNKDLKKENSPEDFHCLFVLFLSWVLRPIITLMAYLESSSVFMFHVVASSCFGDNVSPGKQNKSDASFNLHNHNMKDNVVWDEEQEEDARKQVEKNSLVKASLSDIDRNWLFTEFPELLSCSEEKKLKHQNCSEEDYPGSNAHTRILEVGCGVGNTIFPLIQTNNDNGTFVYGCDFSKTAVEIVCAHKHFNPKRCHAFVCDITNEEYNVPFPPNSLDFVILIFVLSAVNPNRKQHVIDKLVTFLKPGGKILFRDYGRYDMAQLRFKPGRCIGENFYVRGDGTQVYFFTQDEMDKLFTSAGLVKEKNVVDRRLQVNRSKLLKMYRIWIQCEYMKPIL
ncbi:Methyltransferase-like protein 2 [Nymphon striatum]|nr:Methyltransferase-like protein 2 [Nymphon striatum]